MERKKERQQKEAVVLEGEVWSKLRFGGIEGGSLVLCDRSCPDASEVLCYREGTDFEVDYQKGRIRRLPGSTIPDFRENSAFGAAPRSVDLEKIADFGPYHCLKYTVYAFYEFDPSGNETYGRIIGEISRKGPPALPLRLAERIREKKSLIYGVIGDSISTGCEASEGNSYFALFADYMKALGAEEVKICSTAVGGTTSQDAAAAVERLYKEQAVQPDLITVGYGMNDMCSLGNDPGTGPEEYISHIREALGRIESLAHNHPEVILITSMPANPIWNYTSGGSTALAAALRRFARQEALPLADVNRIFHSELEHGKRYEELIISLINHPGDYGHHLYFLMLKELLDRAVFTLGAPGSSSSTCESIHYKHIYEEEKE